MYAKILFTAIIIIVVIAIVFVIYTNFTTGNINSGSSLSGPRIMTAGWNKKSSALILALSYTLPNTGGSVKINGNFSTQLYGTIKFLAYVDNYPEYIVNVTRVSESIAGRSINLIRYSSSGYSVLLLPANGSKVTITNISADVVQP